MYSEENRVKMDRTTINASTERVKWRTMLRSMQDSKLRQTLHVRVAQRHTKSSVFWLAAIVLCVAVLRNFSFFVELNDI